MYNRRDFLKLLMGGAIGAVLDVEKMLWVPGEKTISIPSMSEFDQIAYVTKMYYVPILVDVVFRADPLLKYLKNKSTAYRDGMEKSLSESFYYVQ